MSAATTYAEKLLFNRMVPQGDWVREGLCATDDPDRWFPTVSNSTPGRAEEIAAVKAICWACPVRRACLEWAVAAREPHGIWGGMTEQERALLRRRRAR